MMLDYRYLNNASKEQHKALNAYVEPRVSDPVVVRSTSTALGARNAPVNSPTRNLAVTASSQTETLPVATSMATSTVTTRPQASPPISMDKIHEEEEESEDLGESFIHQQRNRFQQALEVLKCAICY